MRKTYLYFLLIGLSIFVKTSLQAQWVKTNGLRGGQVDGFLLYGDTILANAGAELYFSTNQGQSWLPIPTPSDVSLRESDTDGHNILIRSYDPNTGYRLLRSDDFGQQWHPVPTADTMHLYETFLAFGYIYGSDYHGMYRTNNDGLSWEYTTTKQISNIQFDGLRITGSSYPYILQSLDGGFTWDTLLQVSGNVIDLLAQENHLFAFMQNPQQGCYASSDYGQSWQQYTGTGFNQYFDFIWHNGSIFGVNGSKLTKSPDLGQTWIDVPLPSGSDYYGFSILSTGTAILTGGYNFSESEHLFRSTDDGDSWFPADFGMLAASGKLRAIGSELFATSNGGIFQLDADGVNWSKQIFNLAPSQSSYGGYSDFMQAGDNLLLSEGGVAQVSLDDGITWFESFVPAQFSFAGVSYFEPLGDKVLGSNDDTDFSDYYISDNSGLTFLPIESLYDQFQTSILTLDVDQGIVFALGFDDKIYRSTDGCSSWAVQSGPIPTDSLGSFGSQGCRLKVRGSLMFLSPDSYYHKMLWSKDAGQTWTYVNLATAGLPFGDDFFNDLLYVGNNLIAANINGVFRTQNDGTDWIDWSDGLQHKNILDIEAHDGFLWISTEGSGIWKRPLTELGMQPVAGKVFFDANNNAQQDPAEPNLLNVVVQSLSTQAYTNSGPDGTYRLYSNLSQEQLKVHPPKPYWIASPATQTVAVPGTGADFALSIDPAAKDLSLQLTNVAALRPGFETTYLLNWRNNIPVAASNVSISLNYPIDLLDLQFSSLPPTTQSGGDLTWNLGDQNPDASGVIQLRFKVPTSDSIGTKICLLAAISPLAGDLYPLDNNKERCTQVVGSFDPNDKEAEPADFLTPAQVDNNDPITYTIRFQNTGNFPATFVRITDTLQQNFEPGSFQFLSSSHPCNWTMRGQGEVEFFFDDIQLPPVTTNEPGSHGFVKYSVRPRPNLPHGEPLFNTAHIFFDFNAPVVTNTTKTLAGLVRTIEGQPQDQLLQLMPNPAADLVYVETGSETGELMIQDATGRIVHQQSMHDSRTAISIENLPQGLYTVLFRGEYTLRYCSLVIAR